MNFVQNKAIEVYLDDRDYLSRNFQNRTERSLATAKIGRE